MTTRFAMPILGSIFDTPIFHYNVRAVNSRTGKLAENIILTKKEIKPLSLGAERHKEMLGAIKSLTVKQNVSQIQQSLPRYRDWRN